MSDAIRVASEGQIAEDEAIVVDAATAGTDDDIAVFFSEGRYWALTHLCTHGQASLADGWVEAGEVECPLHGARFSLSTGAALCLPASVPVATHRVEVRDGGIWLCPEVPVEGAAL